MITRLKTQTVYVADQDKALAFYRDALGFEVRRDASMGPAGRWIELAPKGAESCLVLFPKSMMEDWDKRAPSIVFACADTVATCDELRRRGVELRKQPQKMGWGTFASFLDPDGNELGLTDGA
jgi:predicted enzyme related to lactoylglutathione lyase